MTTENLGNNTSKYLKKVTVILEAADGESQTVTLEGTRNRMFKGAIDIGMPDFTGAYDHSSYGLPHSSIAWGITSGQLNVTLVFDGEIDFQLMRGENVNQDASSEVS